MSTNINDQIIPIFNSPNQTTQIKIYLKRKQSDGTYEASWQQIPKERILKYGAIGQKTNVITPFQSETIGYSLELQNADGYYNNDDDRQSFFYGYYLAKTMVKVEFKFWDGTQFIPTDDNEAVVFVGYVESLKVKSFGQTTLEVLGLDNIFKDYNCSQIGFLIGGSYYTGELISVIKDATLSSNKIFQNMITAGAWLNFPFTIRQINPNTETTEYKEVWELLKNSAQVTNCENFIDRKGNFVFMNRITENLYPENDSPMMSCIFYSRCEAMYAFEPRNIPAEIGPGPLVFLPQGGHGSETAMKFGNGFVPAYWVAGTGLIEGPARFSGSDGILYNPNSAFTLQFWFKPYFACAGSGTADTATTLLMINNTTSNATVTASNESLWAGWGCLKGFSTTLEFGIGIDKTPNTATGTFFAKTTTANLVEGSLNFMAIVHDPAGISGTTDTWKVYLAPNGSTIGVICSQSGTIGTITSSTRTYFHFNPLYINDPRKRIGFDNIKMFDYAKTDFSDRDSEYGFDQYTPFALRGNGPLNGEQFCNVTKISSVDDGADNVRNRVIINAASSTVIDTGVSSTASILKYGVKTLEISNPMNEQSLTAENYALRDYLNSPKKNITVDTLINPFIDVYHKVNLTAYSPVCETTPSPFSDGFDFGFGQVNYQLEIENKPYKVLGTKHDLDKKISTFTLREI